MRLFSGFLIALTVLAVGRVSAQWATPRAEVIFPDKTKVTVEIADTDAKRQRGLMFREKMAPSEGMIFLFERSSFYPFWMKNTLIPLDMFWLNVDGAVVSIAHSVPPCKADPCPTYSPSSDAIYVVETVAGFAKQHKVSVGDTLELKGIKKN